MLNFILRKRQIGYTLLIGLLSLSLSAETLKSVAKRRGLSDKDLLAAAKTYTPSGKKDEYHSVQTGPVRPFAGCSL